MKKELKGYIHFYIGSKVLVDDTLYGKRFVAILEGIYATDDEGQIEVSVSVRPESGGGKHYFPVTLCKPILRPLSDMTEEEAAEIFDKSWPIDIRKIMSYSYKHGVILNCINDNVYDPMFIVQLLKKGFDIFGLIEAGIAIDKTKM
jgi:hypothetical protein